MYKGVLITILLFWGIKVQSQSLRVITVAALDDTTLNKATANDLSVMQDNFNKISRGIGYKLLITSLAYDGFNSTALRKTLDSIKVGNSDIIFFYYTGHGFNVKVRTSVFPILSLKDYNQSSISIDEISERLRKKNARLTITFGDLCNSYKATSFRSLRKTLHPKGIDVKEDNNTILRQLFIDAKGNIKIASSQVGQVSNAYDDGSLYTLSFHKALSEAVDKNENITWPSLLSDAQLRLDLMLSNGSQKAIYEIKLDEVGSKPQNEKPNDPPQPNTSTKQSISFDQINRYLNQIANENEAPEIRQKAIGQANQYFKVKAHVKLYVGETETESQSIEALLRRLYLNAEKIKEVNLIEKSSHFDNQTQKYTALAIQEIWEN